MRNRKTIKYLSLISILMFSFQIGNAQVSRGLSCFNYLKDAEYDLAKECFDDCLNTTRSRCAKDILGKHFYAGVLYYEIFSSLDSDVNNLDTNAVEKSILYFYIALLNNIQEPFYRNLDYKEIGDKTHLIAALENPETIYINERFNYNLVNNYLPTIELYVSEQKVSKESKELLEIMLVFKEYAYFE